MKFYGYFKEEWKKEKGLFTSEELEEMGNVERVGDKVISTDFIDDIKSFLEFMDNNDKKEINFISDDYKKEIAKELVHRIVIYALEYFATKQDINNKAIKGLNHVKIKMLEFDIKSFKRYVNPTQEIIQKHKANKKELRRLKQRPIDKIKEDTAILNQALEIIKKIAFFKEDKRITIDYINTIIEDIRLQDFRYTRRQEYYINDFEKKQGSLNKMAIKNYLLKINNNYKLNAKTKINEFCRNIYPLFDIKRYKKLK